MNFNFEKLNKLKSCTFAIPFWPRSTMDSIRVSEAPDPGSIPGEATLRYFTQPECCF